MANVVVKIFKNKNFLSLANNGLVAVFGFFSFLILVRSLPTSDFGEWVLLITTANFIDMFRFGITRTAIVRFLSGADEKEAKELIGSNYVIGIVSTIIIIALVLLANYLFPDQIKSSGFSLFFTWFPVIAVITIPFNNAQSVLQAKLRFDYILLLRIINVGLFMLFLLANFIFFHAGLLIIVYAYLITNFITSLVASLFNWDGIKYFGHATRKANKVILDFGKYTTGTLIGSNLLKSADTFIIGLSPFLGTTGVALYSIPLKLTEIIEIPLRSFAMTAFPSMSKASIEKNDEEVKNIFYYNAGGMTLLMVPVMLITFIFAKEFVYIVGGKGYEETAAILRIFCVYGLLLPIDRFVGVALDSVNRPKQNFIKVVYMTLANIIGDSIMVFGFYYISLFVAFMALVLSGFNDVTLLGNVIKQFTVINVLESVAWVTILFTLIGIFVGFHYLNKELNLKYRNILRGGYWFFRSGLLRLRR